LEATYSAGITSEMMATMDFNELVIRIGKYFELKRAENLEQWRMVRRLCFVQANSMGARFNKDEELWQIEGDYVPTLDESKIEKWRKWLIQHGKMKGEA
jgi:hypothetical protein